VSVFGTRTFQGALSAAFFAAGGAVIIASALVLYRYSDPVAFAGVVVGAITVSLGFFLMIMLPYKGTSDDTTLHLWFVTRTDAIRWDDLLSYKKLAVGWTWKAHGRDMEGSVFTALSYLRPSMRTPTRAYCWITGIGPAFSRSPEDYVTPLDRHAPEKNQRRMTLGR